MSGMAGPPRLIVLLTDFGLKDHYVGVMKGVILSVNPEAHLIDLSHDIGSQDILEAYFLLSNSYRYFPPGTIFVAIVDPGVGTDRAILAVETNRYFFLAPNNGLLGFLEKEAGVRRIVHVQETRFFLSPVSNTFHGRDIFAPVAGHLSLGVDLGEFGPALKRMDTLEAPSPRVTREGSLVGEIVSIDHFGNLVTNIPAVQLPAAGPLEIRVGKSSIRELSPSYGSGPKGKLLALLGSSGTLEISVSQGSAARKTAAQVGDKVRVIHRPK
jgi:S-adenosylmethionine hydrolase